MNVKDWQKKKGILVVAVVVATLALLVGCIPGEKEAPPAQTQTVVQRVNALENRIVQMDSRIAGMSAPDVSGITNDVAALTGDIAALTNEIAALKNEIAALKSEVAALKTVKEEEEVAAATKETTRWSTDVWLDYKGYELADVSLECKRVEDEGDYNPYLLFYNRNINKYYTDATKPAEPKVGDLWWDGSKMWKCTALGPPVVWVEASMNDIYKEVPIDAIEISFHPRAGDRVKVDAANTYLDNYRAPFLDWDITVSERSDGTCRSIKATSGGKFTLPVPEGFDGTPEYPEPYEMRLTFELYYE